MSERRGSRAVLMLAGVVGLESLAVAALAAFLLFEVVTEPATSLASALALVVIAVLSALWLAFMVRGVLRGQSWVRGAVTVWQLLQIAVAIGSFQGVFARADIGVALLVPSVLALVLLFTRSVVEHTSRDGG